MAGIFGDRISNRADFQRELNAAIAECQRLLVRVPFEETLQSVCMQLEAIARWTTDGRVPSQDERDSIDMALRMFREYELTEDEEIYAFRDLISGLHSYIEHWPTDKVASDPDNDEYL